MEIQRSTGPIAGKPAPTVILVNTNSVYDKDQLWERACPRWLTIRRYEEL